MELARPYLLGAIAWSLSLASIAQDDHDRPADEWHWAPSLGVVLNEDIMFEGGLLWAQYDGGGPCTFPTYAAFRVGAEYRDVAPAPIIGPKIGVEGDFAFFTTRLCAIDYIQGSVHDPRLVPEIGLSFAPGLVQVSYGWNIPLSSERLLDIPAHRFACWVNLDRRLIQEAFL